MSVQVIVGDCRQVLTEMAPESVQTCVTSPPYFGLRDYGVDGQIGLESSVDEYVAQLVAVFREVRRVLRDDGTLWLNLGDSYFNVGAGNNTNGLGALTLTTGTRLQRRIEVEQAKGQRLPSRKVAGLKPKDLIGIPWRVAFALQADGWWLRQDIIWHKPNPMPESVRDRCTKAHEYIFLLSKSERYFYDAAAVREPFADSRMGNPGNYRPDYSIQSGRKDAATKSKAWTKGIELGGRNRRSVWTVTTKPYSGAHFATFPPDLIEPCILAGSRRGDTVLDPFGGAGTTGLVADRHGRNAVLIELNPEYGEMAERRIAYAQGPLLAGVAAS